MKWVTHLYGRIFRKIIRSSLSNVLATYLLLLAHILKLFWFFVHSYSYKYLLHAYNLKLCNSCVHQVSYKFFFQCKLMLSHYMLRAYCKVLSACVHPNSQSFFFRSSKYMLHSYCIIIGNKLLRKNNSYQVHN